MDGRKVRGAAFAGAVAMLMTACGQQPTLPGDDAGASPDRLWDRSFASVEVLENGARLAFQGEPFSVGFEHRSDAPVVRWSGGCNAAGSRAEFAGRRIRIQGPVDSTAVACPPELKRGDQWMLEFFAGDPR